MNAELSIHNQADEKFSITLTSLISLASKSHELFKSSDIEEKRRIIAMLFPNLSMNGEKLVFIMRKPFDLMVNKATYQEWLPGKDSNLRPSG